MRTGEKIIVIGGGNSAVKYAIELSRANDVTLSYKPVFTRVNEINENELLALAKDEKLSLKLGLDITDIENENGDVRLILAMAQLSALTKRFTQLAAQCQLIF